MLTLAICVIFVLSPVGINLVRTTMLLFPDISPQIFSFNLLGFEVALRWYALSYIAGFICAIFLMKYFIRRQYLWKNNQPPMTVEDADSLLTYLIFGVILGGRLGYVLFYNLGYYSLHPFDIIRIWDGGMSFHGGFVGVIFAVVIYSLRNAIKLWSASDLVALSTPPGLLFGRIANFINAELWGRPTDVPWGVIFPGDRAQECDGIVGMCARHPSQLYEAGLEGLMLLAILFYLALLGALTRPGLLTGVFALGYGLARFLVEYYRVPDPQFVSNSNPFGYIYKIHDFGVSMGQVLCIPMILFGVALILLSFRLARI